MRFWFLIFLLAPIVEMYLLIRVGGYIGAWSTIALVIFAAMAGVLLLRVQGLATLTRGMRRLEGGELPAREVTEGLLLAVAGLLLIVPGFVTDVLGLLLLVPVLRVAVARRLLARMVVRPGAGAGWGISRSGDRSHRGADRSHSGADRSHSGADRSHRGADRSHRGGDRSPRGEGDLIEGEFESRTEPDEDRRGHDERFP